MRGGGPGRPPGREARTSPGRGADQETWSAQDGVTEGKATARPPRARPPRAPERTAPPRRRPPAPASAPAPCAPTSAPSPASPSWACSSGGSAPASSWTGCAGSTGRRCSRRSASACSPPCSAPGAGRGGPGMRIRLPLGPAVADYYRALFLNAALPGGVLGDVHRAVRHGQSAGDVGRGVRAVVLERAAGQVVLAVVGVAVLLTMPSPVLAEARHIAAAGRRLAVGAVAVVPALRMNRAPPSRRGRALRAALAEARGGLLSRGSWPGVAVSSVVVLAGHLAMFVLAARVAGSAASVAVLLPLAVLALLAMGLPLNVGGWGPREGVTAWAFGAAGLGAAGPGRRRGLRGAQLRGEPARRRRARRPAGTRACGPGRARPRSPPRTRPGRQRGSGSRPAPSKRGYSCDQRPRKPVSEVSIEKYAPKESARRGVPSPFPRTPAKGGR